LQPDFSELYRTTPPATPPLNHGGALKKGRVTVLTALD